MPTDRDSVSEATKSTYKILDEDGSVIDGRKIPDLSDDEFVQMYTDMEFARHFDTRAVSLQRQGRMGTYPPIAGHEAAQIGSTYALRSTDPILPTYRENGVALARDVPPDAVLRYWMGQEEGNAPMADANILPFNIGVGALIPQATGIGMAIKYRGEDEVVLCHFGDGATSEGDFHVGLNFAGVFNTPTVFFCNNNQWAISTPRERQTRSNSIAQKAEAYGFEGFRVDGMDPLAVYTVTKEAVKRARKSNSDSGPTLIESVQYRFGAHTTADDPSVYRDEREVEEWKKLDPIRRMQTFLVETGRIDEEELASISTRNEERMQDAISAAERAPEPDPAAMFDHVFAERRSRLNEQIQRLENLRDTHGDDALKED